MEMSLALEGKRGFKTVVRGNEIMTDLPLEQGGEDKAPTPTELFIASLGACIGIYVTSYMRTAKLNAEGLNINMDWQFDSDKKKIADIKVSVSIPDVDLGGREKAVLAAAERCLIHNTLREHPNIEIGINT